MKNKSNLFNKNFTIIAVGQLISLFGNCLQRYALSLYILDITGSAAVFSLLLSLTILPQIFVAPFGGAIADRINKKKIMVVLDFSSTCLLLLFAIAAASFSSKVLIIGILMTILATIQSIYDPAVRASIPSVVSNDNLTAANSITSQITALCALISPIAAGFLYGFFGIYIIFAINIISFFISAIMELFLSIPMEKKETSKMTIFSVARDMKGSMHYLFYEKKLLLYILLIAASMNLFLTPLYTIGLPYIEKLVFHVSDSLYGISEGALGVGMVIGSILASLVIKKLPFTSFQRYFYMLTCIVLLLGFPVFQGFLSKNGPSYANYGFFTLFGLVFTILISVMNILCITFLQLNTPKEQMGKVMALTVSLSSALMPLGQILFGWLFELFSGYLAFLFAGVAILTFILGLICRRLIRIHYNEKEYVPVNLKKEVAA